MAESPGDPASEDPLSKRIRDYFNTPEAKANFLSGFQGAGATFLSLQDFKKRKSALQWYPGFRATDSQGRIQAGGATGQKVNPLCQKLGHDWREASSARLSICLRCGVERTLSNFPIEAVDDEGMPIEEDEDVDTDLICIWCGSLRRDLDDLERHEEECAPE